MSPNAEEGLRYTPTPVLPFLRLTTGVTGVSSFYSNGDTQQSLRGSIGLQRTIKVISLDLFSTIPVLIFAIHKQSALMNLPFDLTVLLTGELCL